jgi:hypothetical protein
MNPKDDRGTLDTGGEAKKIADELLRWPRISKIADESRSLPRNSRVHRQIDGKFDELDGLPRNPGDRGQSTEMAYER